MLAHDLLESRRTFENHFFYTQFGSCLFPEQLGEIRKLYIDVEYHKNGFSKSFGIITSKIGK